MWQCLLYVLRTKLWWRRHPPPSPRRANAQIVGEWGEAAALKFLRANGWQILGQRLRPNRRDELDIVALRGKILAFIEVKTRASNRFARPASAVNRAKRQALNRAARAFLRRTRHPGYIYRFDIIEVIGSPPSPHPQINHLENAFPFDRRLKIVELEQ